MKPRYLVVTVDTEIDRDPDWRIADPATFTSVSDGIPRVLSELFTRYGVRPTYLISAEVLENASAIEALCSAPDAELGTHLHAEFVEPMRLVRTDRLAGSKNNTLQSHYPPDVERAKLATITDLFRRRTGREPKAFRAGRYAMSNHTLEFLAELGYVADSSVTPGVLWVYKEDRVDYRSWGDRPLTIQTRFGPIVEFPITIERSMLVSAASNVPVVTELVTRAAGAIMPHRWLRPSRSTGADLVRLASRANRRFNVLMFHSVEIIAGRSPYAATESDVQRIVGAMEELFRHWRSGGNAFCSLSEAAALFQATPPR
jgi:hypothetical protein